VDFTSQRITIEWTEVIARLLGRPESSVDLATRRPGRPRKHAVCERE
jgi:hypothetical protein